MLNTGIIAEFNPFHNGHKYLIDTAKKENGAVICVMSGNFVQRGDTAVIPKNARAKMAIECGADLIIELPTPYSMSSAQNFAFGGISLLKSLGITHRLIFGSESGDISKIYAAANTLESEEFNSQLSKRLQSGKTYAKIRSELINELHPELGGILDNPNDTLAVEYITAIKRTGADFAADCIKRIGAGHDSDCAGLTACASLIRKHIKSGDSEFLKKYMPASALKVLNESPISDLSRLETSILCTLRQRILNDGLKNIPDISEGLENRLKKAIFESCSLEELFCRAKTKRYPLARIRRIVLSAYLGIDNSYFGVPPAYIRVLGFSKTGEDILREASKKCSVPLILNTSDIKKLSGFAKKTFKQECLCTDIYSMSLNPPQGCGDEYYQKIYKGDL